MNTLQHFVSQANAPVGSTVTTSKHPALSDGGAVVCLGRRFGVLPEILESAAEHGAGKTITFPDLNGQDLVWSYVELLHKARRIFGGLKRIGLQAGDKVILQLERNHEILPAFWGCLLGGFVPLIMDIPTVYERSNRAFDHVCFMAGLLKGPLLLTDSALHAGCLQVAQIVGESSVRVARIADFELDELQTPHYAAHPDDVAFLCFTSGSTGVPKCIQLTHRCVIDRNEGVNQHNNHQSDDVNLNWLPFDHIGSITEHIRSMQLVCSLVYVPKDRILARPLEMLDIIDRYRVTHTWGPNFSYALIHDVLANSTEKHSWNLSCVRFLISGGEAASFKMMSGFLERTKQYGFPSTGFRPSFGMVELSAGITYYEPTVEQPLGFYWLTRAGLPGDRVQRVDAGEAGATIYGNLGRPVPGCKIRVLDSNGQVLPEETIGRVQIGGLPVARGYLGNEQLTKEVFGPDGWLETGDLGFLIDGNLVLTGRIKEMLIINGVNYYSREIEDMVEAIDGVEVSFTAACAVKPTPDEPEQLAIFFHTSVDDTEKKNAIIKRIRQTLVNSAHLNPAFILPVAKSDIPKTPIGKIKRIELTERFQRGEFVSLTKALDGGQNRVAPQRALERTIHDIWKHVLKVDLGIHDNFFENGGDSIKAVMMMNQLQEKLNGIFHPVSIFDAPTIATLATYLEENYPALFHAQSDESAASAALERVTPAQIEHMRKYLATRLIGKPFDSSLTAPKNPRAIFILSPARSGSTLLRAVLGGNPKLFSPPELYLLGFAALQERRQAYSGRLAFLREGLIRAIMEIENCSMDIAQQLMSGMEERDTKIKDAYGQIQAKLGDRLLVDKTPPYAFNPRVLERMEREFDEPLYIHLVRHPAAMIHSFEEVRVDLAVDIHGDENVDWTLSARQRAELWWLISHRHILDFLAKVPARRRHVVKFEDLVTSPVTTIRTLCNFIGVEFHPDMIEPQKDKQKRMLDGVHELSKLAGDPKFHTHRGITSEAANRWQIGSQGDFLSDETWQIAEAFGYGRRTSTRAFSYAEYQVVPNPEHRFQPFPLTDVQQAYWAGRNPAFELGGRSVHSYSEIEGAGLDIGGLEQAWNRMIERHEMLRAVILPDGTQQILPTTPHYAIKTSDLRELSSAERDHELLLLRERMSHQVLRCDVWPPFEIHVSLLPEARYRIHLSFDALFFDARSKYIIFSEFGRLYQAPNLQLAPLSLSFRDYVLREEQIKQSTLFEEAKKYWVEQLSTLPPAPDMPLAVQAGALQNPKFVQKRHVFSCAQWQRIKRRAAKARVTPSGLLLTVFSDVLRVWNKLERFTINITAYRRLPLHTEVNDIIGDFSSIILMAVDEGGQNDFVTRAKCLQKRLLEHLDHTAFSGIRVLRELAKQRAGLGAALMPVVFTSVLGDEIRESNKKPLAWLGDVVHNVTQTPQMWFDHIAFEEAGGLLCRWNVIEGLFHPDFMDDVFASYVGHLERLEKDELAWSEPWPETAFKLVPIHLHDRRKRYNATESPIPEGLLHTQFTLQATLRPEHPAVIAGDRTIGYGTLYEISNRIGHRLRAMGAVPNALIAVAMEKGWEQIAAVLGILAAGAAYLPIDPNLPDERFRYLLECGQVQIVLTQPHLKGLLDVPSEIETFCVDESSLAGESTTPLDARQKPDDLAYVIFTSGSTGQPKGVMIDHRGALNTIVDINRRFGVTHNDRVLALSALSFDLSVYDVFGLLAAGGTIVMPNPTDVREPDRWAQLVHKFGVTIWNTVPAFMGVLMDYAEGRPRGPLDALRLVMMSGDWIPVSLPERMQRILQHPKIISLGGATEASIWSILHPIDEVNPAWKSIPYGRPMLNQTMHVLNSALEPVPEWVAGMLYIGGIGLAKGYWRDEEKTNASFLTHPRTGERLYRTGDIARFVPTPDGIPTIEFLGREDNQAKIQGFRVELGEIEAAIGTHAAVKHVVVDARGARDAEKQLVAYIVLREGEILAAESLKVHIQSKLPAYMVPLSYVFLENLPLSANGKVDRKALPAPTAGQPGKAPIGSSVGRERTGRDSTDAALSSIVARILDRPSIEADENLFELGATSIHMMRIVNAVEKELGIRVAIGALYERPNIIGLAAACYESRPKALPGDTSAAASLLLPKALLERFPYLGDPDERERFKAQQNALRRLNGHKVQLATRISDEVDRLLQTRHSHRVFAERPISLDVLSEFLSCLRRFEVSGRSKLLYGSAGGLYPVQIYLYVKPERIEGLPGGTYYYHPRDHELVCLLENFTLDERIYNPHINRPVWRRAAFAVFLVGDLSAIVPMYREQSLHFSLLEAGLVTQLLEMHAPNAGLGLCQMGEVDFEQIRYSFLLEEKHILLHSLLGGIAEEEGRDETWSETERFGENSEDSREIEEF